MNGNSATPRLEFTSGLLLSKSMDKALKALRHSAIDLDCSAIQATDTSAIAGLVELQRKAQELKSSLNLVGVSQELVDRLQNIASITPPEKSDKSMGLVESTGGAFYRLIDDIRNILYLLTESVYWSTLGRFEKGSLPIQGTAKQMVRLGSDAVPIVFVLSFLIGLTLAFQSAVQLELLGGSLYLVRGIGISMFSEIGPLMTAIILAGRSGSSITAEIASMVVQEEVKALRTMGIHPVPFLVVPRFQAMSFTVPILTFVSVFAGLLAGFAVAVLYTRMPMALFFSELRSGVPLSLLWQCAVKSLVFGWIIALVACQKGFKVKGGADAVGKATTDCVVFTIAAIILTDAIFSFLFY